MAFSGEGFHKMKKLVSNCAYYVSKYYDSDIIYYEWCSFYKIEYRILNNHTKCIPLGLTSSDTKFFWLLIGFSKPST